MKTELLSVYTDASADVEKGSIAFSVWDANKTCLGRFSSVIEESNDANVLELIGIRTALTWVCEHYPGIKVKLTIDSDTAKRYIKETGLDKEPYRSIADEIIRLNVISQLSCIKSHTSNKMLDYLRNKDVDELARKARIYNHPGLITHTTDIELTYRRPLPVDDTDLLKPVDAKKLVKRYFVEKESPKETVHTARPAIVSNIKSDMTQMEKYVARFRIFKK